VKIAQSIAIAPGNRDQHRFISLRFMGLDRALDVWNSSSITTIATPSHRAQRRNGHGLAAIEIEKTQ